MTHTYKDILKDIVQILAKAYAYPGEGPRIHSDSHLGRVGDRDIRNLAVRTPCLLTTIQGASPQELDIATFVLTRGHNLDRSGRMLDIINILLKCLQTLDRPWTLDSPDPIRATSLYSGSLGDINANLWAVTWQVRIQEDGVPDILTLPPLEIYEENNNAHTL